MNNEKWSTYESNVQAYRSNMIASQSFLLAVGAILYDKNVFLMGICVILALLQLWYIWYRIIRTRTIISDFYKFNLAERFNNCGDEITPDTNCKLSEETYVKNHFIRQKVNYNLAQMERKPKLKYNLRLTRIKLDLILPITFTLMWISLFIFSYLSNLGEFLLG